MPHSRRCRRLPGPLLQLTHVRHSRQQQAAVAARAAPVHPRARRPCSQQHPPSSRCLRVCQQAWVRWLAWQPGIQVAQHAQRMQPAPVQAAACCSRGTAGLRPATLTTVLLFQSSTGMSSLTRQPTPLPALMTSCEVPPCLMTWRKQASHRITSHHHHSKPGTHATDAARHTPPQTLAFDVLSPVLYRTTVTQPSPPPARFHFPFQDSPTAPVCLLAQILSPSQLHLPRLRNHGQKGLLVFSLLPSALATIHHPSQSYPMHRHGACTAQTATHL